MDHIMLLMGRILLGQLFLLAGINKITGYTGTQGYMEAMGVSPGLLPAVIALELLGALVIIIGWQTRWVCYALAAFTLVAGWLFHYNPSDQLQMILFMKNIAIAGGLLVLSVSGPGRYSLSAIRRS